MIDELPPHLVCCSEYGSTPSLKFTPELPQPGDRVRVTVRLPEFVARRKGQFEIVVKEFDSDEVVFTESFNKNSKEPSAEVVITIPNSTRPGYYLAVLVGPGQREIATELLILVDSVSMKKFEWAHRALQYTVDAATARQDNDISQVVLLLEKAAEYYTNSESPQCAGLALVDAAEAAKTVYTDGAKAENLLWAALRFLLLAGDYEGATDLTGSLVDSSASISEAIGRYVSTGRAVLAEKVIDETNLLDRQQIILKVAERSLPRPQGDLLVEKMLSTMRASQRNQYLTNINELLYLAASEIALYSPGVVVRSERGVALHCVTFVSEFQESTHAFAATALAR